MANIPERMLKPDFIYAKLSRIQRWNGDGPSVLQHSLNMAYMAMEAVSEPDAKAYCFIAAMLHDVAEIYLGDLPEPVVKYFGDRYEKLEQLIWNQYAPCYLGNVRHVIHLMQCAMLNVHLRKTHSRILLDEKARRGDYTVWPGMVEGDKVAERLGSVLLSSDPNCLVRASLIFEADEPQMVWDAVGGVAGQNNYNRDIGMEARKEAACQANQIIGTGRSGRY